LGGNVAARLPQRKDLKVKIQGAIFFAAAIREHRSMGKIPSWLTTTGIGLGRFFNFTGLGQIPLGRAYIKDSSKNLAMVENYKSDKLMFYGKSKVGSLINVLDSLAEARKVMKSFDIPFLFVQGGKDKKVNPVGSFEFMEKAKSQDKTLLFYPDLWHDILHEPEIWGIFRRVINWCNQRLIIKKIKTKIIIKKADEWYDKLYFKITL